MTKTTNKDNFISMQVQRKRIQNARVNYEKPKLGRQRERENICNCLCYSNLLTMQHLSWKNEFYWALGKEDVNDLKI